MKEAKNFESLLVNCIIEKYNLPKTQQPFTDSHLNSEEFKKMKNSLFLFLEGKEVIDVELKPKVEEVPTYGNRVESKTDFVVLTTEGIFRFSVKKDTDKSYIHSSGSSDFNKKAFLGYGKSLLLGEDFVKELESLFDEVCIDIQNFESVPKGRTIESHVDHVLETRGYTKAQVLSDSSISDKFFHVRNEMILLYEEGLSTSNKTYKPTLKFLEQKVKQTLWKIFNQPQNEAYAKRLIYDLITGVDRFGEKSLSTAEYIINCEGLFHIDSPECYYISKLIKCFKSRKENSKGLLGRLQNVPRQGIKRETWNLMNYQEIAKTSATADLSIKI